MDAGRISGSRAADRIYDRGSIEPFFTLKEAAAHLNLKYWHLLRMAQRGELKLYKAGSTRNRVLLSEVVRAIRRISEEADRSSDQKGADVKVRSDG
jgi:excisionase family DNA binding protein